MTLIEIKPYRNGWKVFETPGVEPFPPEETSGDQLCAKSRVFSLR